MCIRDSFRVRYKNRLIDPLAEAQQARAMAARYRSEYVDLHETAIDHDLFRSIPVDLMFRYNFVSALNCILAQRLVRVICEHCRKPVKYPESMLVESGLNPDEWRDFPFVEGAGCFECGGTGFRGRSAIHELLDLSEKIREMILDKRSTSEIKRAAREDGMTFLRESAVMKMRAGVTTLREINKVTFIET